MNNDLLKRIDDWLPYADEQSGILASLLRDCRAEIERKATYVPMTDAEIAKIQKQWMTDLKKTIGKTDVSKPDLTRYLETAVIKRLGLEIKHG